MPGVCLLQERQYPGIHWQRWLQPLQRSGHRDLKKAVEQLQRNLDRGYSTHHSMSGEYWCEGFGQLFDSIKLGIKWELSMVQAVLNALASRRRVVVLVNRMEGRNITLHRVKHGTNEEVTRWALYVRLQGDVAERRIACMYHMRNFQEEWTSRYDWRLPAPGRGSDYPFCAPDHWWKSSVQAVRTMRSKPAFVDRFGNGWVVPSVSVRANHWDLLIENTALQQSIGLNELNVVAHGAPPEEGREGALHHLTKSKHPHFAGGRLQCP